jgi:hypothetical protein
MKSIPLSSYTFLSKLTSLFLVYSPQSHDLKGPRIVQKQFFVAAISCLNSGVNHYSLVPVPSANENIVIFDSFILLKTFADLAFIRIPRGYGCQSQCISFSSGHFSWKK